VKEITGAGVDGVGVEKKQPPRKAKKEIAPKIRARGARLTREFRFA